MFTTETTKTVHSIAAMGLLKDWDSGRPEYVNLILSVDDTEREPRWNFIVYSELDRVDFEHLHYCYSPNEHQLKRFADYNDLGKYIKLPYKVASVDWSTVKIVRADIKKIISTVLSLSYLVGDT